MARRCKVKQRGGKLKGRKQRRGGFLSLILSAIASGALAAAAGEGVKAVIDATKRPPPAPVVRARGLNFGKKHKVGLKSKSKSKSSHWIESGLNVGAYPLIIRPVLIN